MDIEKVLNTVRHFLEVDAWNYFHIKVDSPSGQRREMFLGNAPLIMGDEVTPETPAVEESPVTETLEIEPHQAIIEGEVETPEARFIRIFTGLQNNQLPQGADEDWWKNIQTKMALDKGLAQVTTAETLDAALARVKEQRVI